MFYSTCGYVLFSVSGSMPLWMLLCVLKCSFVLMFLSECEFELLMSSGCVFLLPKRLTLDSLLTLQIVFFFPSKHMLKSSWKIVYASLSYPSPATYCPSVGTMLSGSSKGSMQPDIKV